MTLSIIVPTTGRDSLRDTLASLVAQPLRVEDEVIVVGGSVAAVKGYRVRHLPCEPGGHFGCEERMQGIAASTGTHLAFLDDDDVWMPETRAVIARAVQTAPDRPHLFRMVYPSGRLLWARPRLKSGNVSTQMIVVPNDPARLGCWTIRREGDYDFLRTMRWPRRDILWHTDVIARLGHDDA
jgi:glycosyltransferase involved in cell wall biosynthesis